MTDPCPSPSALVLAGQSALLSKRALNNALPPSMAPPRLMGYTTTEGSQLLRSTTTRHTSEMAVFLR